MKLITKKNRKRCGNAAGDLAEGHIHALVAQFGEITIVHAAAPSQNETLERLYSRKDLPLEAIHFRHMDEYLDLPVGYEEEAFRVYLENHIPKKVFRRFASVNFITIDPKHEVRDFRAENRRLRQINPHLVILGIGENGHLAFNDPPCRVGKRVPPLLKLRLDRACRKQQVNEGHFPNIRTVPQFAATLSVPYLLSSLRIVGAVPGPAKAKAIQALCRTGKPTPKLPCSYLRIHPDCTVFIDEDSGSLANLLDGSEIVLRARFRGR